jgi:hypothetical protein
MPDNSPYLDRIASVVECDYKRLQSFRSKRVEFIRKLVGHHYGTDAGPKSPVNYLALAVYIYLNKLVVSNPQVLITSPGSSELRPFAKTFELGVNRVIDEMKLKDEIRRGVLNAFFSITIFKKGLCSGREIQIGDSTMDIGQPYVSYIDFDDFVVDMKAKHWEEVQYRGDKYRIPLSYVKDNPGIYDGPGRDDVNVIDYWMKHDKSVADLSESNDSSNEYDGFMDMCELIDIEIPGERMVVTYPVNGKTIGSRHVRIKELDAPEEGAYNMLCFHDVPSNIMPLPPAALWVDIHDLCNSLARKLRNQANRQKTITGVHPRAKEAIGVIRDSCDGDIIDFPNPDKVKEISFGGIDQTNFAFFLQGKDLFNYFANNLDSIGGLSAQSETLGQDQLLSSSANENIASLQLRVEECVTDLCKSVSWYMFTDPFIDLPLTKRVSGIEIPVRLTPEVIEGDFLDYNFKIKPYSLQEPTPAVRARNIINVLTNVILPLMPMIQSQGGTIDAQYLMEILSRYGNMPELNDLLLFMESKRANETGVIGEPVKKIPDTTRTYIRKNIPGSMREGKDSALMQALLSGIGSKMNNDQKAGMIM